MEFIKLLKKLYSLFIVCMYIQSDKVGSVKPDSVLFRRWNIVLALYTGLYLCTGNFHINERWSVLIGYVSYTKDF